MSDMFMLQQKKLADKKTEDLLNGYSAYADTEELIRLLQRNVDKYNLDVICDETDIGYWFIPVKDGQEH